MSVAKASDRTSRAPATARSRTRAMVLRVRPWTPDVLAIAAIAVAFRLLFRHAYLGYDAAYALVWGREIAEGSLPDYDLSGAPTPHPLANAVSGLLSVLGDAAAYDAVVAISYVSFAVIVWATFRLGQEVLSTGAGTVGAAVVGTSFVFLSRAQASFLDIPFVALVITAAMLEARRPRRGVAVLVLLALAGLLRPEAWGLAAAYWLYLWPRLGRRRRATFAALGASPALIWALGDLIVTGDPFFSFTGAREAAQDLGVAEVGDRELVSDAVGELRDILRVPVLAAGVAGAAAATFVARRRAALALAILALSSGLFLVQVLADVPLSDRLLFLPAVMLALFCGFAVVGWRSLTRGAARTAWAVAAGALLVVLVLTAPKQIDRLDRLDRLVGGQEMSIESLGDLARSRSFDPLGCQPLLAPNHRAGPYLAHFLDIAPAHVRQVGEPQPKRGLFLTPLTSDAGSVIKDDNGELPPHTAPPRGFEPLASNGSWAFYARDC